MKVSRTILVLVFLWQFVPVGALHAQSAQTTSTGDQIGYTAADGRPTLIDPVSRTTTTLIQEPWRYFTAWSPDGGQILYAHLDSSNGQYDLLVSNADGSNLRRYSDSPDYEY